MTIDAHQHFWQYEPQKHAWIDDDMAVIRRDFMPRDLITELKVNEIDGCVAVQADQTIEETNFLIDLASENDFIKGVVGWVDFRASTIKKDLERFSNNTIVKGFRHVVQGEPDPNFLLSKPFLNGIKQLEQYGYTYDILIFPHQLGATLEFVKQFPNQKFMIDHIAKPYIKDGFYDGWATLMKEIASHENVYCKLSGMITEADYNNWKPNDIMRYLDLVLASFGADRCLFGSDWPVCLVAGSYGQVKELITNYITNFSTDEKARIMGNNAVEFYNL
ncbi:amidohydrolase family protein [Maribacter sp. R86514]|uniref:amidohydrolase family protein n=1 Tax=Maribacter sp. R86514 TaxID=3093854 RepID=UPI0037C56107